MQDLISIAFLLLLSATKFFFAPSTTYIYGFGYWSTIAITIIGGNMGIFMFYFLGEWLKGVFFRFNMFKRRKPRKVFSKYNKTVVKVRMKYGLIGLAILTPVLVSIPIGSLIAARYFSQNKMAIPYLMISVITWSFILTSITYFVGPIH